LRARDGVYLVPIKKDAGQGNRKKIIDFQIMTVCISVSSNVKKKVLFLDEHNICISIIRIIVFS